MNMLKVGIGILPLILAVTGIRAFGASVNQEFHVSNVMELTNACVQANSNYNKIYLAPGIYDLSDIAMEEKSHIVMKGLNGGMIAGTGEKPGDTVLLGGGEEASRRVARFERSCVVSNLTVTGGYVPGSSDSGGGCATATTVSYVDCVFSNNYAKNFAGAIDGGAGALRCLFKNNSSGASGGALRPSTQISVSTFRDCTFAGNHSKQGGVAYYGAVWSNCVFTGNSSVENHGVARPGGYMNVFIDCVFSGNKIASGSWTCFSGAVATNCLFVSNDSGLGSTIVESCTSLTGCKFLNNTCMPILKSCGLRNCSLIGNVGNRSNSNDMIMDSTLYNCLVAWNTGGGHSMSEIVSQSRLYNCTVVSNSYKGYATICGGAAVNTVFAQNYRYEEKRDILYSDLPAMTNCLWNVSSGTAPAQGGPVGSRQVDDVRFTDAANGDYTLQRKSPARNAGWNDVEYLEMLGNTDLLGALRVFAGDGVGIVDIGCYECSVLAPGMYLFLR